MPWNEFSPIVRVLAIAARVNKSVFDVFPPQFHGLADRVEGVALNPQPLPPQDPLISGAFSMCQRLVQLAVEATVRGEEPAPWLGQVVDEWCGTPWPLSWPWPGPGPHPQDGPVPDPWAVNEARMAGALVFASMASRLADGDLREALAQGAERLADVAGHG